MYLKIQNPGVAPLEGYTILGVSTTRNSGNDSTIGQFGSGSKHAIGLLLRQGIKPIIFAGKLKLEFDFETKKVNDEIVEQEYRQVIVRLSGEYQGRNIRRTENLGFALEFGTYDWNDISMACREFVSNAIDRTIRQESDFRDALSSNRLEICPTVDESVRAKEGFTRVFLPFTPDVARFFSELPWRFLHFSQPELLTQKLLPKASRGINPNSNEVDTATIYKQGVFVRKVKSSHPSLFDYNFGSELELDESRNVNDSTVTYTAGKAIKTAEPAHLKNLLEASIHNKKFWELENIHSSYYGVDYFDSQSTKEKQALNWKAAYKMVAGDSVACAASNGVVADYVKRKGHTPTLIHHDSLVKNLKEFGIKTSDDVLTKVENDGMEIVPATDSAMEAAKKIWDWITEAGMLNGRSFPFIKCFTKNMDAGEIRLGQYEKETIYINKSISDNGLCHELLTTMLEEMAHHVTQAGDMSRDLQDFTFNLAVRLGMKNKEFVGV